MSKFEIMNSIYQILSRALHFIRKKFPKHLIKLEKNTIELIKYLAIGLGTILIILIIFAIVERPAPIEEKVLKMVSPPSRELRGVWMSRFDYTQSLNTTDPKIIQNYIRKQFQLVKAANCNTVFFQVRGAADAFYHSSYEPWSFMLSETSGEDPGWDPLQFAVSTAHELNLELHAWINTFPAWRGKSAPGPSSPSHPYNLHPDWLVCDENGYPMELISHYVGFSPGNPEVRKHIKNVCMDICSKYDIDGIHFDYIRYPERADQNGYSHDPVSVALFNSPHSNPLRLNWDDWQREQITTFLAETYNALMSIKPWLTVSAAVIGNYNQPGWSGYKKAYQDVARWAEIDKIDLIIPMTYRSRSSGGFQKLIQNWKNLPNIDQPIAAGLGAYTLPFDEVLEEIQDSRDIGLNGVVFFAVSSVDSLQWNSVRTTKFQYPALPPALPWKFENPPSAPDSCIVLKDSLNLVFRWKKAILLDKGNFIRNYVIYSSAENEVDVSDGSSIFSIIPGKFSYFQTKTDTINIHQQYFISAIDAANNESGLVRFSPGTSE